MSEFSDSFHLKGGTVGDAIALLKRAQVRGVVIGDGARDATFLIDPADTDALERLVDANTGVLVQYEFAADHGVWVRVFRGPHFAATATASGWDGLGIAEEHPLFESAPYQPERFVALGLLDEAGAAALGEHLSRAKATAIDDPEHYRVAELLGLEHYRRLSGRRLSQRLLALKAEYPACVAIGFF